MFWDQYTQIFHQGRNMKPCIFFLLRWDTSVAPIVFSDQYIQISTKLSSKYLYGFGENEHESFVRSMDWNVLGMFSRDQFPFVSHLWRQ